MKCKTPYCRGDAKDLRKSPYCSKCRSRRFKDRFPLKYSYNLLRCGAKRRKIEFDLSYGDYAEIAQITGYALAKGKGPNGLTLDRIDHTKGYTRENLRVVEGTENYTKVHFDGSQGKNTKPKKEKDDENPF